MSARSLYFDFLRGISAQLVLLGHALNAFFASHFMHSPGVAMFETRPGAIYVQNLGVLVFFCISGYLVTESVAKRCRSASYGLSHFLSERFARIYTPFFPLLVIVFAVENYLFVDGQKLAFTVLNIDTASFVLNALMLFDSPALTVLARVTGIGALKASALGTAEQLWTVVIEWWIYVSFGLVAIQFLRDGKVSFLSILCLLFSLAVPVYWMSAGNGLPLAWIVGMLCALAKGKLESMPLPAARVLCAICLLVGLGALARNAWNFYHPVVAILLSFGLLLVPAAVRNAPAVEAPVVAAPIFWMSRISYSLYLVHLSIIFYIYHFVPRSAESPAYFAVTIVVANLAALAFWYLFERHYRTVNAAVLAAVGPART